MAVELRHCRYLAAVAEAGQVSRAASRLYMTQPALSQALRALERQVGVELLIRHPGGVQLTPAGQAFLPEARAAIAAADRAVAAATACGRGEPERLVIGVFHDLFEFLIEPLGRFARGRPDVAIHVRELGFVDQHEQLREGGVDVALLCPPPPDIRVVAIRHERLVLRVGRTHHLAGRTHACVADIDGALFPARDPRIPLDWADTYWLTGYRGDRPRLVSEMPATPQEAWALVSLGEAVTACPACAAQRSRWTGLAELALPEVEPVTVGFAWLPERERPAIRAFVDAVAGMVHTAA